MTVHMETVYADKNVRVSMFLGTATVPWIVLMPSNVYITGWTKRPYFGFGWAVARSRNSRHASATTVQNIPDAPIFQRRVLTHDLRHE
jgi:hypothetical protein